MNELVRAGAIEYRIFAIRGQKVIVDADLAGLYGVATKALLQALKRNRARFPADFVFRLTGKEFRGLRSQFVTSNRGGRRHLPYAFTEQGVAMLSSVLRSERALRVNIAIMRTFVRLRGLVTTHKNLARRLDALERRTDGRFTIVFGAIRKLIQGSLREARRGSRTPIGFLPHLPT